MMSSPVCTAGNNTVIIEWWQCSSCKNNAPRVKTVAAPYRRILSIDETHESVTVRVLM